MNKIFIALLLVLIVGCTNVNMQHAKSIEKETKTVAHDIINGTSNIKDDIINSTVVQKIKDVVNNDDLETPSIVISRISDDTDIEDFGDVI